MALNEVISIDHRRLFGRFLIVLILFHAVAMGQARHLITGSVLSFDGGTAISGATIQCVTRREGARVVISRGISRTDGSFGIVSAPVAGEMELWVSAKGHAPMVLEVRSTTEGQGLHVGRMLLQVGWALSVGIQTVGEARIPATISIIPADDASRRVDLTGPRLLQAVVEDGRATFPNIGQGEYLIVIHDRFESFVPRVIPWVMGAAARNVPGVIIESGRRQRILVRELGERLPKSLCIAGLETWDEASGEEYELAWTCDMASAGENRASIDLKNLPLSILALQLHGQNKWGKIEVVSGGVEAQVTMQEAVRVHGQIREDASGKVIPHAWVQFGERRILCGADGTFQVLGLSPSVYSASAGAALFTSTSRQRIVLNRAQLSHRLNFFLKPTGRLDGVVRSLSGKGPRRALISVESADGESTRAGDLVWGSCRDDGAFSLEGVPSGRVTVKAVRAEGRVSEVARITISARDPNRVELATRFSGQAKGHLRNDRGLPIVGAEVFLVDASLGTDQVLRPPRCEVIDSPAILFAASDKNGAYAFSGIPPSTYFLVVVTDEGPPAVSGPLHVQSGDNRQGFGRVLLPRAAPIEVTLPPKIVWGMRNRSTGRVGMLSPPVGGGIVSFVPDARGLIDVWPLQVDRADRMLGDVANSTQGDRLWEGGATVPSSGKAILKSIAVPYGRVLGQVLASNAPTGPRGALLLAYPLGRGRPLAIEVEAGTGLFDAHLPRGRYMLLAQSPRLGRGRVGPISVAMSVDESRIEGLQIRLQAAARALGRVDLSRMEAGAAGGLWLTVTPQWESLIHPWRGRFPSFPVVADGSFDLHVLGVGPQRLASEGSALVLRRRFQTREGGLSDWPVLTPDRRVHIGDRMAGWKGRIQGGAHPNDMGEADWVESRSIEDNQLNWDRRTDIVSANQFVADPRSQSRERRVALRGVLHLDGLRQMGRPFRLIGLNGWAYSQDATSTLSFVDETGQLNLDRLASQPYALVLEWCDDSGIAYRAIEFLERSDAHSSTRVMKPHVDFTTTELEVLVTRLHDGTPLPRAVVRVRRSDMRGILAQTVFARDHVEVSRSVSDDRGRVRFVGLPTGNYDIEVTSDEAGRVGVVDITVARKASRNLVEVSMGDRSELLIDARTSSGAPLVHAEVFCFDEFGLEVFPDHRLLTGGDGRLAVSGLGSGTAEVHIQPIDGVLQSVETVTLSRGGTAQLTAIELDTGRLLLQIQTESGRPIRGAELVFGEGGGQQRLFPLGSRPFEEWQPVSGTNGEIRVGPLAPGTYDVSVHSRGFRPEALTIEVLVGREATMSVRMKNL